jgi:hypothetical protein
MDDTQAKYVDKIQKLLRKAEDKACPEPERETCIRMAQNLMQRWAIDDAMLAAASPNRKDDLLVNEEVVIVGIYRFPLSRLSWYTMRNNNIKAVLLGHPGPRTVGDRTYKQTEVYMCVGYQTDLHRFRMMEQSLHIQCVTAESAWWREHKDEYTYLSGSQQHQARRGFMFGFAEGANRKMEEGRATAQKEAKSQHGTGMELVLVSREEKVKNKLSELFPHTRSVSDRRSRGDYNAHSAGYEAGKRADTGEGKLKSRKSLTT